IHAIGSATRFDFNSISKLLFLIPQLAIKLATVISMSWLAAGWGISYSHHVRAMANIKKAIGHMAHRLSFSHNIWLFINHIRDAKLLINGSTGIK
ncbi:MAG: hypothetical protein EBT07_17280, partial [Actinobacteria bacterium]|nr:hypothetical protein [Actinomycetota bacterium]